MLERFTSRARHMMRLATEEARSRGHAMIGPEHLLIAILRDGEGMAVRVLERLAVQPGALVAAIDRLLSAMPASPSSEPTFSPELRDVLQAAIESRFHPRHGIGTENLLLGLLAYEESAVNRMLRAAGVDPDRVRHLASAFYDSMAIPISAEGIGLIGRSKWGTNV